MFKNIPKFFFIFFFLINFNQVFAESKFNIFNSNIDLISLHSFYDKEKKIINWSDSFVLISQTQNIKKYNLENKIFKIERTIIFKNKKIEVNDKYINKLNKKIGIISNYKIANKNISQFYASGIKIKKKNKEINLIAENPTLLIISNKETFGIYFNDIYSKVSSYVKVNSKYELRFSDKNLILGNKATYTKKFTIYKFKENFQYFDFINYLRKELNVHTKIDGNFFWFDPFKNKKIISDTLKFKKFLKNYNIKYLLVRPWIDYSDYNFETGRRFSRKEVKNYFLNLKKIIKTIDPNIKLLVPLQSNIISLNHDVQNYIQEKNKIKGGFNYYKLDIDKFIKLSKLNLNKNELILDKKNQILFETFWHDKKYGTKKLIEIALPLKAYANGYLYSKLINQIDFIIDEIGFDGVYIDQFNQYFISPYQKISYYSQNNNQGEIDIHTGKIIEEYENIVLNTLMFEEKVIQYLDKKNSYAFFNTHHLHDNLRSKKVTRFAEGFWYFWSAKLWMDDNYKKFQPTRAFYSSHLSTPISLSLGTSRFFDENWSLNSHNVLVKNLRFCIYNGNLMYFSAQDIEKLNLSNDKLNIFQKIFPIDITSINQKTIIGKNKIITIKNLKLSKNKFKKSNIFIFDNSGYQIENINNRIKFMDDYVEISIDEKSEILLVENKLEIKN